MNLFRRLFYAPAHQQPSTEDEAARAFVSLLETRSIDRNVAASVLKHIRKVCSDKAQDVNPDDELYRIYGIVDDDLDELVTEISQELFAVTPTNADVIGVSPVRTVGDLAALIQHIGFGSVPRVQ